MADATRDYSESAVTLLRANLGYYGSSIPDDLLAYLKNLLTVASRNLARARIQLVPGQLYDDQLQVMYAAWLYRKASEGSAMPLMLLHEIRDRQVEQALTADEEASA